MKFTLSLFFSVISVSFSFQLISQPIDQSKLLTLQEAIELSIRNDVSLDIQNLQIENNTLEEENRRVENRPKIAFNASLPNLSRSIEARPLPDGRDAFVNRSTMYNRIGFNFEYEIPNSNSVLYGSSTLERLDILRTNTLPYSRNYFFTPIRIGFEHSFFRFNEFQWEKESIRLLNQKLTLEKAYKREIIINEVIQLYLNSYQLQEQMGIVRQTIIDTDSIYKINEKLYDIGLIGKIELLRLTQEQSRLSDQIFDLSARFTELMISMNKYLQIAEGSLNEIVLASPDLEIPDALLYEMVNRSFQNNEYIKQKQLLTLRNYETELQRVIQNRDMRISISASAGANNADPDFDRLLVGMQDQEGLGVSLNIPLTGSRSRIIEQEITMNELEMMKLEQERENLFSTNHLQALVSNYNQLKVQLENIIDRKATSEQIYDLSVTEYLNGTLSLTDLFNAKNNLTDFELRSNTVLNLLFNTYYEIRAICMYDFVEGKELFY